MLKKEIKLNEKVFSTHPELSALRDGFGEGIVLAGEENKEVVVLCADLTDSTRSDKFQEKFPERFFEIGVAEQNLASVASGFAVSGKIPFISSYAVFSPGRNLEQIRTTICYNDSNVKIAGHHAGLSVGPDGATHQALEDIALMRTLPNMKVIVPVDAIEAKKAILASSKIYGPVYIRLARSLTPIITSEETEFNPGIAYPLFEPKNKKIDVLIVGAGPILYQALLAAKKLEAEKINSVVLNLHTIKPLDTHTLLDFAKKAKAIITVEEHQLNGGIGSAVSEFLSQKFPVPIEFIAVKDSFGESGTPSQLFKKFELDEDSIIKAVKKVIKRK